MKILIILISLILSIQDIKSRMIYSPLNSLLLIIGFFYSINLSLINRISSIIIIPTILIIIDYIFKDVIGYGDIEFISAAGLILGFYKQNIMIFIACIIAFIYVLINKKKIIPMIPFLTIGLIITIYL